MKKAITEYAFTGACQIDRNIAIKRWNLLCRIYKREDTYKLVELTPKGKRKLKVEITKEDAEFIIHRLMLRCVDDRFLKMSCSIFLSI